MDGETRAGLENEEGICCHTKLCVVTTGSEMVREHSGVMILMGPEPQISAMLCKYLKKPNSSLLFANCPAGQLCGPEGRRRPRRVSAGNKALAAPLGSHCGWG